MNTMESHSAQSHLSVRKYLYVFLCYVCVILVSALIVVVFFESRQMNTIDARLAAAARGLKFMLAEDFHDRAVDEHSITMEEELRNRYAVSSFAREAGLVYLYTLAEKDGQFYFSAPTVTPEEAEERERWYFYPYEDAPPLFADAFKSGKIRYATYRDQWGTFRSVAISETSPGGVRYLACADMDISDINSQRLKDFLLASIAAFVLIISSLPLLYLFNRASRGHTEQLLRVNRELTLANDQLKELDSIKSSLLSKVSHELRTPLTSIVGFAKLMARDIEEPARLIALENAEYKGKCLRIQRNLSIIISESDRLTRMINDNLDLFKIESGKMEWRDARIDSAELAREAFDAVLGESSAKPGVEFRIDLEPSLPPLYADRDRILQVLINLLSNALKFTEEGSVVLSAAREGRFLKFIIKDTGIGIPEQDHDFIFEELFRVAHDDTISNPHKGTGLGLAISKQIVNHYDGTISVQSEPGNGSTFTVLLKHVE